MQLVETAKKLKTYWKLPMEGRHIPFKEMGAYSVGGVGVHFFITLTYIYVNADFVPKMYGIDVIHGRFVGLATTLLNLLLFPMLGKWLDNRRGKKGRFKPVTAIIAPVTAVFLILAMWSPQMEVETARVVYAYATSVPAITLATFLLWLYNAMPAVMTPVSQERTDMLAPASIIVSLAPTLMNIVSGPLRNYFIKQGREYMAFRVIGIACVGVGLLLISLILLYVKERTFVLQEQKNRVSTREAIPMVLKNKPFMVFQIANIFGTLKMLINSQLVFIAMLKFSGEYGQGVVIASALSFFVGLGATPSQVLSPFFSRKMEKKWILILSQLITMLPLMIILLGGGFANLTPGTWAIFIISFYNFMHNFNAGTGMVIGTSITAEQYDYQQYQTGHRLEGFMNTVSTWTAGLIGSLLSFIPTMIQRTIGFQQGDKRFDSALVYLPENMAIADRWFDAATLITVVSTILWMLIIALFYKLNAQQHAAIMAEIEKEAVGNTFDGDTAQPVGQE